MDNSTDQILQYDFDRSIGYLVCSTAHAMETALNDELQQQGITFRQWQVLACLALMGESSQTDIALLLGIEKATLGGVLERMERDGWIRRSSCSGDRRKRLVQATERVKPVWEKMAHCARRVRRRAVAGIRPADLNIAWNVLERIRENLRGLGAGSRRNRNGRSKLGERAKV
jgi:MarR family transcriptional regulator for hemolysin